MSTPRKQRTLPTTEKTPYKEMTQALSSSGLGRPGRSCRQKAAQLSPLTPYKEIVRHLGGSDWPVRQVALWAGHGAGQAATLSHTFVPGFLNVGSGQRKKIRDKLKFSETLAGHTRAHLCAFGHLMYLGYSLWFCLLL